MLDRTGQQEEKDIEQIAEPADGGYLSPAGGGPPGPAGDVAVPAGVFAGPLGQLLDGGDFKRERRVLRPVRLAGADEPDLVLHLVRAVPPGAGAAAAGGGLRRLGLLPGGAGEPLCPSVPGADLVPRRPDRLEDGGQRGRRLRLLHGPGHGGGPDPSGGLLGHGAVLCPAEAAGQNAQAPGGRADPVYPGL